MCKLWCRVHFSFVEPNLAYPGWVKFRENDLMGKKEVGKIIEGEKAPRISLGRF